MAKLKVKRCVVKQPLLWLATLWLLNACSSYPLGMSEEQWLALTPQQQYDAQLKQAELDKLREERYLAQEQARLEELKQQQAQLALAREQAKYGERVQCVLQQGKAHYSGKWREVDAVAMDVLAFTELAQPVALSSTDGRYNFDFYSSFDGQTLSLCRYPQSSSRRDCARLIGTFSDYQQGLQQQINQPELLQGLLRCQFVPKVW